MRSVHSKCLHDTVIVGYLAWVIAIHAAVLSLVYIFFRGVVYLVGTKE